MRLIEEQEKRENGDVGNDILCLSSDRGSTLAIIG